MNKKYTLYLFSLFVFSVNTFAAETGQIQTDLSAIREAERQQIIHELSYRLDKKESCDLVKRWTDSGSGADRDGYFYIPSVENNVYIIGGFGAQTGKDPKCVTTVSVPPDNPADIPALLVTPVDWKMIWNDEGSGAEKDGSMWEAIPPDSNYKCLGSIPQKGHKKPDVPNYRCVHNSLTEKIVSSDLIWSDIGSNAARKVTMMKLPNTSSFIAIADRVSKIETYDLKADPVARPDPKRVDEILATRMAKIEKDLEASMQEQLAQKQQAVVAEQQRLAEEAEQKRLAEEAEQKRLAEEAGKKRLAEEAEQKRLAEEAGKKRLAEEAAQKKLAEGVEKKQLVEKSEQKQPAEEEKGEVAEEPNKTEAVTANENTVTDVNKKKSGGVNSLIIYILKVFLVVTGLFLLLGFIIYRSMKGSKNQAGV